MPESGDQLTFQPLQLSTAQHSTAQQLLPCPFPAGPARWLGAVLPEAPSYGRFSSLFLNPADYLKSQINLSSA